MEKQANAKSLPLHVKLGEGLAVKPGCGGAWQVGDRSDATFDEMAGMDLHTARGPHSVNYPVDC